MVIMKTIAKPIAIDTLLVITISQSKLTMVMISIIPPPTAQLSVEVVYS